ncbi:MAG TPA: DUF929 family protein [Acidothermaceae bacterium]
MADGRDDKGRTSTKYAAKKAATERIAAQRAAQQRADRKRNLLYAGGGVVLVIVVIGGIVLAGLSSKKSTSTVHPVLPASSTVTNAITAAVPLTSTTPNLSTVTGPPKALTGAALTSTSGKPEVLYIGAEYCPYCGVTRWPLAVALSRFGTFSNLETTYSAANDSAGPNTPTLDFRHANYKSDYVDFTGIEYEDGAQKVIGTLTTEQNSLFNSVGGGAFPFIDFGGKWAQSGASYATATLAGLTPEAVAGQLTDASSKVGSSVQASADVFTAAICSMDGGKPASVCTSTGVVTATTALASLATASK